jgi:ubiquinone biosynthesis accessory factor UbiJ
MPPDTRGLIDRALRIATRHALADSPRARALLAALAGKCLTVAALDTPWSLTIESTGSGLRSHRLAAGALADVRISGTPLSLLALLRDDPAAERARSTVRIDGEVDTAQQFRELIGLLKPDLEHGLSELLGRSGAHLLMRGLRAATDWTRAAAWTSVQNLAEYLAHESGDLVSNAEAQHYLHGVDELREQLDRIEARTVILTQRTRQLAGGREPG